MRIAQSAREARAFLALPGPQSLQRRIGGDLAGGYSEIMILPRYFADSWEIDLLTDDLTDDHDLIRPVPAGDDIGALVDRIAASVGLDGDWQPSSDPVRDLVSWPAIRGRGILLRSWEHDVTRVLQRWGTVVKGAGLPPQERPRLVVLLQHGDVPDDVIGQQEQLTVRTRWWWDVLGRIDNQVHIAVSDAYRPMTLLERELVSEIAGPDLDLVESLARHWNGRLRDLEGLLRDWDRLADTVEPAYGKQAPRFTPGPADLDEWNKGIIDRWDGRRRPREATLDRQGLEDAIWRAQCSVLLVRLDDQRSRLEGLARAKGGPALAGQWEQLRVVELGTMVHAIRKRWTSLPDREKDLLYALWNLRNALAHKETADPDDLDIALPHLGIDAH